MHSPTLSSAVATGGRFRWFIVAWFFLMLLIVYMDRVNLAMAAPLIMNEFNLRPSMLGLVMSGFTIGYTILLFPGGFLVSRFSARKILAAIMALRSAASVLTGCAWGFVSLMVFRIGFGLAEGPMLPAINATVNHWMLNREKATAAALYITALPLGIISGNIASGYAINAFGWRFMFYVFGALGLAAGGLGWIIIRDTPAEHPAISRRELERIEADYHPAVDGSPGGSTFRQLMKDPWLWVNAAYNFFYSFPFWANLHWLPTYFVMARGTSILKSGYLSSVPWISGLLGLLVLGALSDRVGRKYRGNWMAACQFLSIPFTAYAVVTPSVIISLVCFSVSLFFVLGSMSIGTALIWELFDRADVAKAYGLLASWMTGAGILAPYILGIILEKTNSFNMAYYIFSCCAFLAGCTAVALHVRERRVREMRIHRSHEMQTASAT
ncbi:MAG: MFS transporter [Deltaproteobacteria bacterium]|nr:MFS transporter [Deltaproteobacteria bacterium]